MRSFSVPIETFPVLEQQAAWLRHGFVGRVPGIETLGDKAEVLANLAEAHAVARAQLGFAGWPTMLAEQVHGNGVALVAQVERVQRSEGLEEIEELWPDVDGFITRTPGIVLGIHVADCCAVWLADPVQRAIGLVHAGRKGTELGIVPRAIQQMQQNFQSDPADLIVQLSPCIRPPLYESDFAAQLVLQLRDAGVNTISDCAICTGTNRDRYYSYRMEKGKTGRMLALMAILPGSNA